MNTNTSRIIIITTAQGPSTKPIITPVDKPSSLSIVMIHKHFSYTQQKHLPSVGLELDDGCAIKLVKHTYKYKCVHNNVCLYQL